MYVYGQGSLKPKQSINHLFFFYFLFSLLPQLGNEKGLNKDKNFLQIGY
jgi:hypothetical protein